MIHGYDVNVFIVRLYLKMKKNNNKIKDIFVRWRTLIITQWKNRKLLHIICSVIKFV